jgi:hypothetical protein
MRCGNNKEEMKMATVKTVHNPQPNNAPDYAFGTRLTRGLDYAVKLAQGKTAKNPRATEDFRTKMKNWRKPI